MLTDTQKNSVYQYFFTIMALFKYGSFLSWITNPIGNIINSINDKIGGASEDSTLSDDVQHTPLVTSRDVNRVYDDFTGKSQIELQNQLERERAEEEYQRNLQSIGDTASAYEAAGFNRNLMYSSSPAQYNAPHLQAYSGSAKLDTMLNRVGKVLQFIPAMYNATAALERIDQEREKTAQSQLRTTGMGLSLLQNAYKLDDLSIGRPYGADIDILHARGTRNRLGLKNLLDGAYNHWNGVSNQYDLERYMDAAQKYRYGLLDAIDISNQLRRTRNSYLGYQYDLDRRFGAAGRIVGMASQGLSSIGRFAFPILNNFGGKFK